MVLIRVIKKRWGEVIIRKQGEGKNNFDKSKSFSIIDFGHNYSIDEIKEILETVTDLTEKVSFTELMPMLKRFSKK